MFVGNLKENRNIWFGLELGPSFVQYRKEVETLNPAYGGTSWVFDKYLRDNIILNTIGFSSRVKFDWMFSKYWGLELALFSNINRFKSNWGIECCLLFGKLNKHVSEK